MSLTITPNVTQIIGTANQISISPSSGNGVVTLSLPQDIATTSSPTFAGIKLSGAGGSFTVKINSVTTNALEQITTDTGSNIFQSLLETHNSSSAGPVLSSIKSRGTAASPTAVVINDQIGFHNFYGYTGNASVGYQLAAQVQYWICADGSTVSTTSMPGRIQFFTTPDGSITPSERMRINCTGTISLFGPLQMNGNKIYGDVSNDLILSANSTSDLDYLRLSGTSPRIQIFNGQPSISASQTVMKYNPTYTNTSNANVTDYTMEMSPTLTWTLGASGLLSPFHFHIAPTITFNSGLAVVYRVFNYAGTHTATANAGFASSFNMFVAGPTFNSSTAAVSMPAIGSMYSASPIYNAGNAAVGTTFDLGYIHNATYNCTGASSSMTVPSTVGFDASAGAYNANTAGSALTISSRIGFRFKNFSYTATGTVTITENVGIDLIDQTASTGNLTVTALRGIRSALTSGTGRFFIYASGSADSVHTGQLRLGDTTAPTALLDIIGKMTVSTSGLVTKYNNISTVGCGIPSVLATVNLTTQAAAVGTTTLYAVPASPATQYKLNWNAKVTRAATTSSTLGGLTITYTDPDGVVQTVSAGAQLANGTVALTATTNNTTTLLLGYEIQLNCKASTNIQYAFAYASSGVTTMQYNLNVMLEAC